jgi:hypothetical protein
VHIESLRKSKIDRSAPEEALFLRTKSGLTLAVKIASRATCSI